MSQWVHATILPLEIAFLLAISIYLWRHPRTSGARVCALMTVMTIVWLLGDFITRVGTSFDIQLWGERIKYIGVVFTPLFMMLFSWSYQGKYFARRQLAFMFVIPVTTLAIIWNPQWQHLFWQSLEFVPNNPPKAKFGLYFWAVHIPYCYILGIVTFTQLLKEAYNSPKYFRTRTLVLAVAISAPFISNIAYISGLTKGVSYTGLSFVIFTIVFAFGIFRHRLVKNNPIAYETVFQTINDSVIVLDVNNLVTDLNPAAAILFGRTAKALIGQPAEIVFAKYSELYAPLANRLEAQAEVTLTTIEGLRYFDVMLSPLYGQQKVLLGRIITLRDITERKLHQQEVFAQQLLATQEAFAQQLIQSQESERQRIATELHDGLGQNLLVIKNRALLGATLSDDSNAKDQFAEINSLVATTLSEVRTISHNLRPPHLERLGLTATIEEMIEQTAAVTGLAVTVNIAVLDGLFPHEMEIHLFRITQECLNNVIKHAHATRATIAIVRAIDALTLKFEDNGNGFDTSIRPKGAGHLNIAERVRMLRGTVRITSAIGKGTVIDIQLPLS